MRTHIYCDPPLHCWMFGVKSHAASVYLCGLYFCSWSLLLLWCWRTSYSLATSACLDMWVFNLDQEKRQIACKIWQSQTWHCLSYSNFNQPKLHFTIVSHYNYKEGITLWHIYRGNILLVFPDLRHPEVYTALWDLTLASDITVTRVKMIALENMQLLVSFPSLLFTQAVSGVY